MLLEIRFLKAPPSAGLSLFCAGHRLAGPRTDL